MIEGMITPLVTPFHRDEKQTINYEACDQLVEHLIREGIDGLFLLGSNGEMHVLREKEKTAFAKHVIEKVNGKIPVYVGTGSCSTQEAIELSKKMESLGADALSILAPYFFRPTDEELYQHFSKIAQHTSIPIILYNIPKTVGYSLSPSLVAKLAELPNIKGIKDSSGDLQLLQSYIDRTTDSDMNVLVGSDSKIAEGYRMGAKGAVAGTSNLLTKQLVGLHRALLQGEKAEVAGYQNDIERLRQVLKFGTVPSILKRSVELAGIAEVGPARLPVLEPDEEVKEAIKKMLQDIGVEKKP